MHIILGILAIILIAVFWDQVVYIFGGILILLALILVVLFINGLKTANMSDEEYQEQESKKKETNPDYKIQTKTGKGLAIFFLILAIGLGLGGYKVIVYNSESIEADKIAYLEKLNKKINDMDENERSIFYSFYDKKFDGTDKEVKNKQDAYDKTQEKLDEEKKALQKKYDDQAKYEEWIAWQKAEEEKKALQKKYDDQAKYEEWIAWQKAEEEKKVAEARKAAKAAEEQRRKENTISLGDTLSKVEKLKGHPNNVTKQITDEGTFIWYDYYKNGFNANNGIITYQFHNSILASIVEAN